MSTNIYISNGKYAGLGISSENEFNNKIVIQNKQQRRKSVIKTLIPFLGNPICTYAPEGITPRQCG